MTTTVEEHIAGLRAAGERMPRRFLRAGLLYELVRHEELGEHYTYEPVEDFVVDGVLYRPTYRNNSGTMVDAYPDNGGSWARMDWRRPTTDEELEHWMRSGLDKYLRDNL